MASVRCFIVVAGFMLATALPLPACADDIGAEQSPTSKLRSYEPNLIGYRYDSNDVPYMNFKISLMYPLWLGDHWLDPYFAFTGEFGQYIGTRDSSPVIGKRYNPKLFVRYEIKGDGTKGREWEYLDFGYAHESNGQGINNAADYQAKRLDLSLHNENPDFARDYISRGWDYVDVMWKRNFQDGRYATYANLKYYLDHGLLQREQEEYYSWEGGTGHRRREVDGINLRAERTFADRPFAISKVALGLVTGYDVPLEYNTFRSEITFTVGKFPPFMFWVAEGYNSNLADYYERVTSVGLAFEMTTD